jgi:hypothetical protein
MIFVRHSNHDSEKTGVSGLGFFRIWTRLVHSLLRLANNPRKGH